MKKNRSQFSGWVWFSDQAAAGFTLVELLVATAVAAILGLAIVANYIMQTRSYEIHREMANMQQNMRAAMYMLSNDIRNSGRDSERSGRYGIQNIRNINPDADDANGYPGLTLTSLTDTDGDGIANPGAIQMVFYQVIDLDGDGQRELRRCTETIGNSCDAPYIADNWPVIMDGIEDIGIAYAYDDGNGDLARFNGNANAPEIWAIDTNNDNFLDTNLDTNGDGNIDTNDDLTAVLNPTVDTTNIRAARIWLLARSSQVNRNYTDSNIYVLGRKQLNMTDAANANRRPFRHFLLESVVALQNYELDPNQ